jgi:hypothetical protein
VRSSDNLDRLRQVGVAGHGPQLVRRKPQQLPHPAKEQSPTHARVGDPVPLPEPPAAARTGPLAHPIPFNRDYRPGGRSPRLPIGSRARTLTRRPTRPDAPTKGHGSDHHNQSLGCPSRDASRFVVGLISACSLRRGRTTPGQESYMTESAQRVVSAGGLTGLVGQRIGLSRWKLVDQAGAPGPEI